MKIKGTFCIDEIYKKRGRFGYYGNEVPPIEIVDRIYKFLIREGFETVKFTKERTESPGFFDFEIDVILKGVKSPEGVS